MAKQIVSRFERFFTALVILSLVGIWLIFAGISYESYRAEWRSALLVGNNVAVLLQRDIARNIELYDLSLKAAVKGWADPKVMGLAPDLRNAVLFDESANASGLGSILIIDAKGLIVMNSRAGPAAASPINLSDRDYFQVFRDGASPENELYISHPFKSRLYDGAWSIGLSRRLNNPDGSFAGVVVGSVRINYLLSLFNEVMLPPDSSIALLNKAGLLIVRVPFKEAEIGHEATSLMHYQQSGTWTGDFVQRSKFDGVKRLFVYRQIGGLPIIQSVGLSVDRFLAEWLGRVAVYAAAFLVLSALIVILGATLRKELRRRTTAELALGQLATTDALTRLANRRRFDEVLAIEWRRAARSEGALSLLMIDCDLFKAYNDVNGHLGGDAALRAVADALKASISRPADLPARYGGEEFVVLLPATDLKGARVVAETIRKRIIDLNIPHLKSPFQRVTVSIGAACRHATLGNEPTALILAADHALYRAKAAGRNAVVAEEPRVAAYPLTANVRALTR